MNNSIVMNLSMVSEEGLRAVEEALLCELGRLRRNGDMKKHDELEEELRKLEDHFERLN